MCSRWAFVLFAFLAGCEKPAPEPAAQPSATATPKSEPSAPLPRAACVVPSPSSPPPAPPYAVDPRCPADPERGSPMVPIGHVSFPESRDAPRLEVELMLTKDNQQRGLMYRKSLAADKGMLFAWRAPSVQTFWMHNTCIPLDMMFIDEQGFIAGILENVPTMNDDGRSVDCPVGYVLEVNAGWSRKHGVAAGQRVLLENVWR